MALLQQLEVQYGSSQVTLHHVLLPVEVRRQQLLLRDALHVLTEGFMGMVDMAEVAAAL